MQPSGDWYGNLRSSDAPLVLRSALAPPTSSYDFQDKREKLVHWPRWRGRQGLSKEQMAEKYEQWGPPVVQSATIVPKARGHVSESPVPAPGIGKGDAARPPTAEPSISAESITLRFVDWQGEEYEVQSRVGETIKDAAKRRNLPSIEATCGGVCECAFQTRTARSHARDDVLRLLVRRQPAGECATCHVYLVTPTRASDASLTASAPAEGALPFAPRQRFSINVPPPASALIGNPKATPTDEEQDMLEYAIGREEASRLACQLIATPQLAHWMQSEHGRILLPKF